MTETPDIVTFKYFYTSNHLGVLHALTSAFSSAVYTFLEVAVTHCCSAFFCARTKALLVRGRISRTCLGATMYGSRALSAKGCSSPVNIQVSDLYPASIRRVKSEVFLIEIEQQNGKR